MRDKISSSGRKWPGIRLRGVVRMVVVAGAVGLRAVPAAAQSGPLVHLELDCPQLKTLNVERVLKAELGVELVRWDSAGVTVVQVTCDEMVARVQVRDPVTRKTVQRGLNLETVPERSRDRLVALATAELVIASWSEIEVIGDSSVEPTGVPPPPEAVEAARGVVREEMVDLPSSHPQHKSAARHGRAVHERALHRVVPMVSVRGFPNHWGVLGGGGVRYGSELRSVFSWAVDFLLEGGEIDAVNFITSTVGGQIAFSHQGRYGAVRGGAGLRLGVVNAHAEQSTAVPWGWPMLVGSLDIWVTQHLTFEVAGEGGYATLPGHSSGGDVGLSGFWLSGQSGLGWRW